MSSEPSDSFFLKAGTLEPPFTMQWLNYSTWCEEIAGWMEFYLCKAILIRTHQKWFTKSVNSFARADFASLFGSSYFMGAWRLVIICTQNRAWKYVSRTLNVILGRFGGLICCSNYSAVAHNPNRNWFWLVGGGGERGGGLAARSHTCKYIQYVTGRPPPTWWSRRVAN